MEKQHKISRALDVLIGIAVLFIFSSFGFQDNRITGWYQQWFPNLNGSTIKSMTFLDSLTGFAVTNSNSLLQEYILKTTNGGDNWLINYTYNTPNSNWSFVKISFVNSNTGFAFSWTEMFRTTNAGINWDMITNSLYPEDIAVINKDTMLAVSSSGFGGGVYRSTNGGLSWQRIWGLSGSGNPSKIYMYNANMGFTCGIGSYQELKKTTNGGFNWADINDTNFLDIKFIDTLTGYKVFNKSVKKSTNGGITWIWQNRPNVFAFSALNLSLINKDTLWFVGPAILKNNYPFGIICKTTNGGINWGYQLPDTAIRISNYPFVNFVNKNIGWAYQDVYGVHTTSGGNDTTFFTGVNNNITTVPGDYILYQNYPNPFNQSTIINYKCSKAGDITLKIFDIRGREVEVLVNEKKSAGSYSVSFNANNLTSGIYFYSLFVNGSPADTKKMIYLK